MTVTHNDQLWSKSFISIERILTTKSGNSMEQESSYLLNQNTAPSPEAICSAMEQVMEQQVNFASITDHKDSPVNLSTTAFNLLHDAGVSIDMLSLSTKLNDNHMLTVEAAQAIIAEAVTTLTAAELLNEHGHADLVNLCQGSVNYLTQRVLGAAYWVGIMTRDTGIAFDDSPGTFDQTMKGLGMASIFEDHFYNRDIDTQDNNPMKKGITGNQWNFLSSVANDTIKLLAEVKHWNANGFASQTDRKDAFAIVLANAVKKKEDKKIVEDGKRIRQQEATRIAADEVVNSVNF